MEERCTFSSVSGDAERLAKEAAASAPRSFQAWYLQGQVNLARGKPIDALADCALCHFSQTIETFFGKLRRFIVSRSSQKRACDTCCFEETYGSNQVPADVLALEGLAARIAKGSMLELSSCDI